jgi:hypothetical protein
MTRALSSTKREIRNACCHQQSSNCLRRVRHPRSIEQRRARSKKYDTGASDTEIKIGNIMPYSGPASAYGVIGKTRGRLLQEDQRCRRYQRPQDQFHQL